MTWLALSANEQPKACFPGTSKGWPWRAGRRSRLLIPPGFTGGSPAGGRAARTACWRVMAQSRHGLSACLLGYRVISGKESTAELVVARFEAPNSALQAHRHSRFCKRCTNDSVRLDVS